MPTEITYHVAAADPWAAAEAVTADDRRITAAGQLIQAVTGGVTGGSAPDFTGQEGATLSDGTVQWQFCCFRDYARLSDFLVDIGVGISNTLVSDDEKWEVYVWHDRRGAYSISGYQQTVLTFAETCTTTNNVTIRPAPGDSIWESLVRGTDPVKYDETRGTAVKISYNSPINFVQAGSGSNNCEVKDFQIRVIGTNAGAIKAERSGFIVSGCLIYSTGGNEGIGVFLKNGARAKKCIGISDSTDTGKSIFATGYNGNFSNCLAVYSGIAPADTKGFWCGHTTSRFFNNVSVNFAAGFGGSSPSNSAYYFGNVSSDDTADTIFGGTGAIINAANLVTDFAGPGTVDAQPPDGSPVFTDSTAESDFTYTPETDVFGEPRGLNDGTAYRGAICSLAAVPDYSLVVNNVAFTSVVEAVNLAKSAPVNPDDAILGMVLEDVVTYAEATADVDDLAFASYVEAVEMSASRPVVVGDVTLGMTLEDVTISASSALAISDVLSQMTVEQMQMTGLMTLQVTDARLGMVLDAVNLQAEAGVSVDDVALQMSAESCTIQGEIALVVNDVTLGSRLEQVGIIGEGGILPSDVSLHMRVDPAQLSMTSALSVDDVSLNMAIEEAGLSVDGQLTIHNACLGAVIEEIGVTGTRAVEISSLSLRPMIGSVMMVSGVLDLPSRPGVSFLIDTRSVSIIEDTRKVSIGGNREG